MQYSPAIPAPPQPIGEHRPFLVSLDSGCEFSIDHLVDIAWLIEHQDDELEGYIFEDSLVTS
jgi:hypothetical protein